jgi:tripartite ATP-independent transporter DctP family solute receptor
MKKCVFIFMVIAILVAVGSSSIAAPINIVLGHPNPEAHSLHKGYVKFKELVETKTNGGITVAIHSAGALGGDRQLAESVNIGTIQMALNGSMMLGNYDPRFFVFDLPFLFDSNEAVDKIINGSVGKKLTDVLPGTAIRVLAFPENGYRNLSNNKREVERVSDLNGLKIRVMETPVHLKTFEILGAVPTPVPFPEVYGALQTKMIDAQENANSLFLASRYSEVQSFYTIPGPLFLLDMTIINEGFFQSLSPEYQKIIQESAWEAAAYQRKISREENDAAVDLIKANNVKVTYLSPEAIEEFKERSKPVYEVFKDRIGLEFMNEVFAELGRELMK